MMILEYYIGLSYDFQLLKKIQLRYFINVRLMGRIRFFFFFGQKCFFMTRMENVKIREFFSDSIVRFFSFKNEKKDEKSNKNIIIIE